MRQLLALVLLLGVACGPPAKAKSGPASTMADDRAGDVAAPGAAPGAATDDRDDGDVEDVATRLGHAAFTNDRPAALALTLAYSEVAELLRTPRPEADWDREVAGFFDRIAREAAEDGAGARVVGAKVLETRQLTPSQDRKVTRDLEVAIVQLVIEHAGETLARGLPMIFLKTAAGWRFSPVK